MAKQVATIGPIQKPIKHYERHEFPRHVVGIVTEAERSSIGSTAIRIDETTDPFYLFLGTNIMRQVGVNFRIRPLLPGERVMIEGDGL